MRYSIIRDLLNKLPDKFQAILLIGLGLFFAYITLGLLVKNYSYLGISDIIISMILLVGSVFFIWAGVAIFKNDNRDSEEEE